MKKRPHINIYIDSLNKILSKHLGSSLSDEIIKQIITNDDVINRNIYYCKNVTQYKKIFKATHNKYDENFVKFIHIYNVFRESKKLPPIRSNDRNITSIYKMYLRIIDFATTFRLNMNAATITYFRISYIVMNRKYSVNRIEYYEEDIYKTYQYELDLKDSAGTITVLDTYNKIIENKGIPPVEINIDNFYIIRDIFYYCTRNKIKVKDYILSQFKGMEWTNKIPSIRECYGNAAFDRYGKYHFTNKKTIESPLLNKMKNKK